MTAIHFFMLSHYTRSLFAPAVIIIMLPLLLNGQCAFKQPVLSPQLAEWSNLMPSSTLTTYRSQYFKFYVGRSWVGGCVLHGVNIHQEATYVCIGDHQLWNNSVLPSLSPARLPCDKAEMEVCCRSEWGCNYFLTSLSASKPSHSALQLMRCPCGIVMLSKWMPLWQPRALWAADYCRVSPNNAQPSSCRSIHYKAYMTQPLLAALVRVEGPGPVCIH